MFEFFVGVIIGAIMATIIWVVEDIKYEESKKNDSE